MKKTIVSLALLGAVSANPVYAAVISYNTIIDQMKPFLGNTVQTPSYQDNTIFDPNLVGTFRKTANGYALMVAGQGGFGLFGPTPTQAAIHPAWTGTQSQFFLVANFSNSGTFIPTGSELLIKGELTNIPAGTNPDKNSLFFDANLTSFGYNASQGDIGFTTQFKSSWANQPTLTGGSLGESIYLVDGGLFSGHGALSPLISAFQSGNLGSVAGHYVYPLNSIAILPLPAPISLFLGGLTAIFYAGRRRAKMTMGA